MVTTPGKAPYWTVEFQGPTGFHIWEYETETEAHEVAAHASGQYPTTKVGVYLWYYSEERKDHENTDTYYYLDGVEQEQ